MNWLHLRSSFRQTSSVRNTSDSGVPRLESGCVSHQRCDAAKLHVCGGRVRRHSGVVGTCHQIWRRHRSQHRMHSAIQVFVAKKQTPAQDFFLWARAAMISRRHSRTENVFGYCTSCSIAGCLSKSQRYCESVVFTMVLWMHRNHADRTTESSCSVKPLTKITSVTVGVNSEGPPVLVFESRRQILEIGSLQRMSHIYQTMFRHLWYKGLWNAVLAHSGTKIVGNATKLDAPRTFIILSLGVKKVVGAWICILIGMKTVQTSSKHETDTEKVCYHWQWYETNLLYYTKKFINMKHA